MKTYLFPAVFVCLLWNSSARRGSSVLFCLDSYGDNVHAVLIDLFNMFNFAWVKDTMAQGLSAPLQAGQRGLVNSQMLLMSSEVVLLEC
jgi:hypothetical protein